MKHKLFHVLLLLTVVPSMVGIAIFHGLTYAADTSNDATLSNFTISSGTFTPAFASTTTDYTDSVANTVSSVTVTPTVNEGHATVKVNGNPVISGTRSASINLNVGGNTITVVVTAQDIITDVSPNHRSNIW